MGDNGPPLCATEVAAMLSASACADLVAPSRALFGSLVEAVSSWTISPDDCRPDPAW